MSRHILVGQDALVGNWVCSRAGGIWLPGRGTTVGLLDPDKGLLAGCLFEDWNGANIVMHVAAVPGRQWLNREFLWFCFHYPFEQIGAKRITGMVAASNTEALKFDLNLGFSIEATLKDAHPDGDLHVLVMRKEHCRWLNLKGVSGNGITQETGGAECSPEDSKPN